MKIASHIGGKWIEARDLQQGRQGKGLAVFVRQSSGNKAGGNSQQTAPAAAYAPQVYENLSPTVLVAVPNNNQQNGS